MINTVESLLQITNIPPTANLLFIEFKISVVNLQIASSVLNPVLKSYFSLINILYLEKCVEILVSMTVSNILENDVKSDTGL
jgi:hypothetical protein